MNITKDEIIFTLEIREFVYSFLKQVFNAEPSESFVSWINENKEVFDDFPFLNQQKLIKEGIGLISKYIKNNNVVSKEAYEKLHWDFTRLFIGPKTLLAPPWSSAYLNAEGLLFQEETMQVRKTFLKYCLISQKYPHEADDHIGLELDFMGRLNQITIDKFVNNEVEQLRELLIDQKSFLQEHLLKWIPQFTNNMAVNAKTNFYCGMGKLLYGFILIDVEIICELVNFFNRDN